MFVGVSDGLKRVPRRGVVGKVTLRQKPWHKISGCNGGKYIFFAVIPAKSMSDGQTDGMRRVLPTASMSVDGKGRREKCR